MKIILDEIKKLQGDIGFYYKNMVTGETWGHNENKNFCPASVIKLPILMEIFRQAELGNVKLSERILVKEEDKMPSCGALSSFTGEVMVDIETLCKLMIIISDNTATNVLISHFGISELNKGFEQMGLHQTKVNRLLFDEEKGKQGIENIITPREIGELLEKLQRNVFINKDVSERIKAILLEQQIDHKIKEMLPLDTMVGSKSGDDDYISNDVGIVYAKQPFVVCFISNNSIPSKVNPFIRKTSLRLFDHCNV